MSLKKQIEKEQDAHQSMKWDEMKTGGGEKNVGQVTGTGIDAEDPEGDPGGQSVGTGGVIGGTPEDLEGDEASDRGS
jgi:hypothetical protein